MKNPRILHELSNLTVYADGKERQVCDRYDHVLFEYVADMDPSDLSRELVTLAWAIINQHDEVWQELLAKLDEGKKSSSPE